MQISFPYSIDSRGRTAETDESQHIQDLIQQVLFTIPGERVNRPDFGSGLMQMVFMPGNNEIAVATQFLVQGALQQWLGNLIRVEAVQIKSQDATLNITIQYVTIRNQQRQVVQFERQVS